MSLPTQTYSPSELEGRIDLHRIQRDWASVLQLCERYAHLFDVGEVEGGSSNRSRAFYWGVMAEIMLFLHKDFQKAAYCVKSSADFNPHTLDWRVHSSKVLLARTSVILTTGQNADVSLPFPADLSRDSPASKLFQQIFTVPMRGFKPEDREKVEASIASFGEEHRLALLETMILLTESDIVQIVNLILFDINHFDVPVTGIQIKKRWILCACKQILHPIQIQKSTQLYGSGELSDYCFWLHLDAAYTKSLINEYFGDLAHAKSDVDLIVQLAKSFTFPFAQLLPICRELIIHAACRLPLLELQMNLPIDAASSFRMCLSGDSVFCPHFSPLLQVAMQSVAADVFLKLSMKENTVSSGGSVSTVSSGGSHVVQLHAENAFTLLSSAKKLYASLPQPVVLDTSVGTVKDKTVSNLTTGNNSNSEIMIIIDGSPPLYTLQSYLPSVPSDPFNAIRNMSPGKIAVSLGAVMLYLRQSKNVTDEVIDVLEWGLSNEPRPSLELKWNLAFMYAGKGLANEAIEIIRQCMNRSNDSFAVDRGDVLKWLGLGFQPCHMPWLPALMASELTLVVLEIPKTACEYALDGLRLLYNQILENLHSFVRNMKSPSLKNTDLKRMSSSDQDNIGGIYHDKSIFHGINTNKTSHLHLSDNIYPEYMYSPYGAFELLLVLGKAYSASARNPAVPFSIRLDYAQEAEGVFKYLLSDGFLAILESDEYWNINKSAAIECIAVNLCVVLAEMGEISKAVDVARGVLLENNVQSSRVLHTLAILLTCTKGDVVVLSTSLKICQEALDLCTSFPFPKYYSSVYYMSTSTPSANSNSSTSNVLTSPSNCMNKMNLYVSLARIMWSSGDFEGASKAISNVIPLATGTSTVENGSLRPKKFAQSRVKALVYASQIFRLKKDLSHAQYCVQEAWKLLYSSNKYSRSTHSGDDDIIRSRNVLEKNQDSTDARRVRFMRAIPTVAGWKLPEGCGWGVEVSSSCEAEVLAECADILLADSSSGSANIATAIDTYGFALSIFPSHVRSMLSLCKLELSRYDDICESYKLLDEFSGENDSSLDTSFIPINPHILHANELAKSAATYSEFNSDVWYLSGRTFELMNEHERAADCYVKSIEYQAYTGLRDFSELLW